MSFTPIHVNVHPINETFVHGVRKSLSPPLSATTPLTHHTPFKQGMLKAAIEIHTAINSKGLLNNVFLDHPDYQLVVAGHSLGAGAASVLALLFKLEKKYPTMVCYAFSPPGCLFRQLECFLHAPRHAIVFFKCVLSVRPAFLSQYTVEISLLLLSLGTIWCQGNHGDQTTRILLF